MAQLQSVVTMKSEMPGLAMVETVMGVVEGVVQSRREKMAL